MKRLLLNLLTALSLLLCAAVCVLWVRSYRCMDTGGVPLGKHSVGIMSAYGDVSFFCNTRFRAPPSPWWQTLHLNATAYRGVGMAAFQEYYFLGFGAQHVTDGATVYRNAAGPHWVLVLALLVPLAVRVRGRSLALKRGRGGLCPACGYDLRATPDQCPECGTMAPPAGATA